MEFRLNNWSDFDTVWDERANRSLGLLREAADAIAETGLSALQPLLVVESLLSVPVRPASAELRLGKTAVAGALIRQHGATATFREGVVR